MLSGLLSVKGLNAQKEDNNITVFHSPAKDSITIIRSIINENFPLSITIYNLARAKVKTLRNHQN